MYKPNGGALAGLLGSSAGHQLKRANAKLSIVKKAAEVRFNIIVKDISVESLTISGKIVDGPVELCTVCFAILQHVKCKVIICEEASGMGPKLQHLKTSSWLDRRPTNKTMEPCICISLLRKVDHGLTGAPTASYSEQQLVSVGEP
jgi:hypothetical protein